MSLLGRWFGVKGPHSMSTRATLPVVDGEPVEFDIWLTPSPAPWEYVPGAEDGPFRLVRSGPGPQVRGYAESDELVEMIELFAKFHQPQRYQTCTIVDRHCNVIVGWVNNDQGTFWGGCRHGYGMFACFSPVEAAMAESMAAHGSNLEIGEMFRHDLD